MDLEIIMSLMRICVLSTSYFACLAFLAWAWQRRTTRDAFQLVVALTAGVLLIFVTTEWYGFHISVAIGISAVTAWLITEKWPAYSSKAQGEVEILSMIVIGSLSLILFEWVTSHVPIALPLGNDVLRQVGLFCAIAIWCCIFLCINTRFVTALRLGTENKWALEYWSRPFPTTPVWFLAAIVLAWIPILAIPLTTVGILSSSILRDVAIAIIFARVAGSRGPFVLLVAASTLAILRVMVGFAIVSPFGPPLVEVAIFVCIFIWLRYRSSRTKWE